MPPYGGRSRCARRWQPGRLRRRSPGRSPCRVRGSPRRPPQPGPEVTDPSIASRPTGAARAVRSAGQADAAGFARATYRTARQEPKTAAPPPALRARPEPFDQPAKQTLPDLRARPRIHAPDARAVRRGAESAGAGPVALPGTRGALSRAPLLLAAAGRPRA